MIKFRQEVAHPKRRLRSFALALLICAFASSALPLLAQSDLSGVSGTITDASGAFVRDAAVRVTDEATGVEHKTVTNSSGYYTIPSLSPGRYTIAV